ncbi:hypothetical protein, partial [Pantoea agglomerans]|uniref:hypothetical protein n=1 Tax=Enterobacter agglomerans TaxID=549 RepID=UPI0020325D3A
KMPDIMLTSSNADYDRYIMTGHQRYRFESSDHKLALIEVTITSALYRYAYSFRFKNTVIASE